MSNIRRYKSRNSGRRAASRQNQSGFENFKEAVRNMDPRKRIMAAIAAVFVVIIIVLVIVLAASEPESSGGLKQPQNSLVPVESGNVDTEPSSSPSESNQPSDEPDVSPSAKPDTSKTLKTGSKGDEVKSLNQRLADLGYLDEDKVNDVYSDDTKAAVKAFQKASGLDSDGISGSKTLEAVYADNAIKAAASDNSGEYKTLKTGDDNSSVKKMQERLKELGYDVSKATGYYGTETEAAVKAFQTKNSLKADGIAGEGTQKLLFSDDAKKAK